MYWWTNKILSSVPILYFSGGCKFLYNPLTTVLDYVITKWQQQSRKQDLQTNTEHDTSVRFEMSKLKTLSPWGDFQNCKYPLNLFPCITHECSNNRVGCLYQYQFGLARPLFNWGTDRPGQCSGHCWTEWMKRIKKEDFWPSLAVNREIYAGGFTNFCL